MSWLDRSPKRHASKSKAVPGSISRDAWSSSSARTYGSSRRPTSSIRGAAGQGGLFRGQPGAAAGQNALIGRGLSSMYEEDAKSPPEDPLSARLSPGLDSSPTQLAFFNRGLDLDIGFAGDDRPVVASSSKDGSSGKAGAYADPTTVTVKKPATRMRRGKTRSRAPNASGSLLKDEVGAAAVPDKRKAPTARKGRGTDVSEALQEDEMVLASGPERQQASPSARRDRSPARRGAGRPERSAGRARSTRKVPPPVTTKLRAVTRYASDDERSESDDAKVSGDRTTVSSKVEKSRNIREERSASGSNSSGSNSSGSNSSSSGEEEWRDDHLDFSVKRGSKPKPRKTGRRDSKVDERHRKSDGTRAVPTRALRSKEKDRNRTANMKDEQLAVESDDEAVVTPGGCDDMEALEESEGDDMAGRAPTPAPLISLPGTISREVSVSLDSSVEGILVGDKRRRGSGRGKSRNRGTEDLAHRSSRSRHLSPLIPVSGGFGGQGFSLEEEDDSDLDDIIDLTMTSQDEPTTQARPDLRDDLSEASPTPAPAPAPTPEITTASPPVPAPIQSAASMLHRRTVSATPFSSNSSPPALAMTSSPALLLKRQQIRRRSSLSLTYRESSAMARASTGVERELAGYGDDSPPTRLSRSLSLSHTSAPPSALSGAGCAKVTRSSLRRRSRANSTSSPLPVLDTSASLPTVGAGDGSSAGNWGTWSLGSGAFPRHDIRRRRPCANANSVEGLHNRTTGQEAIPDDSGPIARSCRMTPGWGPANETAEGERPISLPSGFTLGALRGMDADSEAATASSASKGDPGVGWVLRAPGSPEGRHRSQSFASGILSAGLARMDQEGESTGNSDSASEATSNAQTPQGSPQHGTSAAMHRAHGLSSVARRMNRLEIRSPDVQTIAAQAQQEILSSPAVDAQVQAPVGTTSEAEGASDTPVRPRVGSLPTHLTPVGNRSSRCGRPRLSGAGGSPPEFLRDYLSGQQGQETDRDEEEAVWGSSEDQENMLAPATPLAATPSAPATSSPPGITCARSAALGLASPTVPGLFRSGKEHRRHDGYNVTGAISAAGDGHVDRRAGKEVGKLRSEMVGIGGGGAVGRTMVARGSPAHPRRGVTLGEGQRSRTVPEVVGASVRESPGSGFLIRRKSVGQFPSSANPWPAAFGGDEQDMETPLDPPTLSRLTSTDSGSLYFSCACVEPASESSFVDDQEDAEESLHHSRSISSPLPLPLMTKNFETPSACVPPGAVRSSPAPDEYGGAAVRSNTVGSGKIGAASGMASAGMTTTATRFMHCSPSAELLGLRATSGGGSRRTSTDSTGATSYLPQFETPQAETKYKWGSQPQNGDWGISQRSSAGSLRRLAGRVMAFAGRAAGRCSSGGLTDPDLLAPEMQSPSLHSAATPLRTLQPLEDIQLPARSTPGSTTSSRSAGSLAFRNSLGTLSERGEGRDDDDDDDDDDNDDDNHEEQEENENKLEVGKKAVVQETMGDDVDAGSVWAAAQLTDSAPAKRREGSVGDGSGRYGRSRLSGLLMTEGQREAQRRKQSKAKRRRVSISIKHSRRSSAAISSRMAGLSLLEAAEAASPGPGKAERRTHHTPVQARREYSGGVISEGEEDEADEEIEIENPRVLQTMPAGNNSLDTWCRQSRMSEENPLGGEQCKAKPQEDERGDTPAKVREDLEKSLTELNNLSLSLCNSEDDGSPTQPLSAFIMSPNTGDIDDSSTTPPIPASPRPPSPNSLEALRLPGVIAKALCMLSVDELLGETPLVCMAWRKAAIMAFAEVASDLGGGSGSDGEVDSSEKAVRSQPARENRAMTDGSSSRGVWPLERLLTNFPWGSFLSEGACKQVYKVWNAAHTRMEALSVMDREEIIGDEEVVSQEVRVSILASSLVQRGICPNFVQTFGLFRSASPPPAEVFGTAEKKYPSGRSPGIIPAPPLGTVTSRPGVPHAEGDRSKPLSESTDLRYQFIGMELCEHGDAEVFIKAQENRVLPTEQAIGFLFQMAFALYAGRAELSLRHFDVKLLNFFVGDASRLLAERDGFIGGRSGEGVTLRYGLGEEIVELCLPEDRAQVVKLADFGTADVNPLTVGMPVEKRHFTTLENTPIEQLCCGSEACQGYASDTFALALAAVHLFTGEAPYEEIMEEVECPDELYDALVTTWDGNCQYRDVCEIIVCGEEEGEEEDAQDATLMNTFYRYLVLFGVPERDRLEEAFGCENPVWKAVGALLGWKPAKGRGPNGGRSRRAPRLAAASKRFCSQLEQDQAMFSLHHGSNVFIERARHELEGIPGGMTLVRSMASFVPEERPTMLEVMTSEAFASFRGRGLREDRCLDFMTFARQEGDIPLLNV